MAEDNVWKGAVQDGTGKNRKEPDHILCISEVLVGYGKEYGLYSKCNGSCWRILRSCQTPTHKLLKKKKSLWLLCREMNCNGQESKQGRQVGEHYTVQVSDDGTWQRGRSAGGGRWTDILEVEVTGLGSPQLLITLKRPDIIPVLLSYSFLEQYRASQGIMISAPKKMCSDINSEPQCIGPHISGWARHSETPAPTICPAKEGNQDAPTSGPMAWGKH